MIKRAKWVPLVLTMLPELTLAQGITELRNGTVADAEVLNQNFAANNDYIDSVEGRVTALEAAREAACSASDFGGLWEVITASTTQNFEKGYYLFGADNTFTYEYVGRSNGAPISGTVTGEYTLNLSTCEVSWSIGIVAALGLMNIDRNEINALAVTTDGSALYLTYELDRIYMPAAAERESVAHARGLLEGAP